MEVVKPKYREMLLEEFETRCKRNSAYSLRAFARDIELSPPSLSLVLAGKQGLSLTNAKKISKKLGFNDSENNVFCMSVQSKHARSPRLREDANAQLGNQSFQAAELSLDYFKIVSDWYHFAILELTDLESFESDPKWIAKRLGITVKETNLAIERLLKLELLVRDGKGLRQTTGYLTTPSGVPNRALKNFHQQLLLKANNAIVQQEVTEREFSSVILAMDAEDLQWAKDELKKFRRSFLKRLSEKKKKTRLYCVSMNMFALDQDEYCSKKE